MTRKLSILNIGGHPKDAIMYAGGTLAKHVANGDRVCTLTPTHGLSHHGRALDDYKKGVEVDLGAMIEERKQELIEAASELGVNDVRFLGHNDDVVLPREEIIEEIAEVIGDVRPDIVITHWPYDTVAAHANATQMTLLAMEAAACIRPGKAAPHGVHQVYYHSVQGRTNYRENYRPLNPTTVVDITDVVDKKVAAMNKFSSQYYGGDGSLQRKLGEMMDGGIHAVHAKVPYAEAFVADKPQLFDLLPLSEYDLEMAAKTEPEQYEHMTQMLIR